MKYVVDVVCGNITRFINHSCTPDSRISFTYGFSEQLPNQLFAIKRIKKYEEITNDYAIDIKSVNKSKYKLIVCKCAKNAVKRFVFES